MGTNPALQGLMQGPSPGSQTPDTNPTPAPTSLMAALGSRAAAQPQSPQLSHQMTVAAITHFQAVKKQLTRLAANPGLGKENIRPAIFNATADLLGEGFFTLPQLMNEIKSLPVDPPGQKKWVMQHLSNVTLAQHQVLDDHRANAQGSGDFASEAQGFAPVGVGAPVHSDLMSQVSRAYKGG